MAQTSIWQQILDPSHRADPFPLYAELRKTPVVREEDGSYVVSTYREIVALLHDPRLSSEMRNLPELGADTPAQASEEGPAELPPNVIQADPPEHDRIRRQLTWNFGPPHRPGRVDSMIPDLLEIVTSEIDGFTGKEQLGTTRVDIVDDFAYPFPVTVICRLLGVPREDEALFQAMSDAVIKAIDPSTGGIAEQQRRRAKATADLGQYFAELLDARHGQPGDDLLSGLLSGDGPEAPMSYEQILSNAALLLVAGHETTVNLITNGMLTLLRHPEVLDRLRRGAEPDLATRVVEELLRYEPPVQFLSNRYALDDIEVAGTTIPKGSPVNLVLAAGSRDPGGVPNPDRFDPDREHNEHLGFGGGIHYCFGAPLARPETQIALTELARRLKNPRLVADPPPYRPNPTLRGPRHLLVDIDGVNPAQHRPP
ncbi:cytochrome P450 [Actinacidiphila soli]|jgi:cytochrome P450|uniref:cytochrome P450 n=1 Tax=Actinacidiphila soli TaxID=2487275 RepID=UPI000FCA383F|nr:cytochrome P450 [Actinacidiphila soli]